MLLDETLLKSHSTLGISHVILLSGNSDRVDAGSSTLMIVPSDRSLHWMFSSVPRLMSARAVRSARSQGITMPTPEVRSPAAP